MDYKQALVVLLGLLALLAMSTPAAAHNVVLNELTNDSGTLSAAGDTLQFNFIVNGTAWAVSEIRVNCTGQFHYRTFSDTALHDSTEEDLPVPADQVYVIDHAAAESIVLQSDEAGSANVNCWVKSRN